MQIAVLGYGAYLVLEDNTLSAGIIFAASIISARALAPVDQAVGGWKSFVAALQSYRRLKDLLAAAPKPKAADGAALTACEPVGREARLCHSAWAPSRS